jgi:hypothetical protein
MWKQYRTLSNTTALAVPGRQQADLVSAYRRTPYRKMELIADVAVPLAQAAITGSLSAVAVFVTGLFYGWPWYAGPFFGVFVTGVSWLGLIWSGRESLWVIEEVIGRDLDGDGETGPPAPAWGVRAEITEGKRWQFADIPVRPGPLHKLAGAVIEGDESFTERTAAANDMTQAEFYILRDLMVERGLAAWNHPTRRQNGVSLTRGGLALLRAIVNTPPPTDNL